MVTRILLERFLATLSNPTSGIFVFWNWPDITDNSSLLFLLICLYSLFSSSFLSFFFYYHSFSPHYFRSRTAAPCPGRRFGQISCVKVSVAMHCALILLYPLVLLSFCSLHSCMFSCWLLISPCISAYGGFLFSIWTKVFASNSSWRWWLRDDGYEDDKSPFSFLVWKPLQA